MAGKRRLSPLEVFELLAADARKLIRFADVLDNTRANRMRRELREGIGGVLRIPKKHQGEMDCVESDDLFVVLKPGTALGREDFDAHPSFLRQAIVAACAAFETYLADRAEDEVRGCIRRKEPLPSRLAKVTMTVGQWDTINQGYQYKRRGITEVVLQDHLAKESSTAPSKVGQLLSLCGVDKGMAKLDTARQVKKGTTESQLTVISDRRNAIAHSGDRVGRGRRKITSDEVEAYLSQLESIVQAIEAVFSAP